MKKTGIHNHNIENLIQICKDQATQMPTIKKWWETTAETLMELQKGLDDEKTNLKAALTAFNILVESKSYDTLTVDEVLESTEKSDDIVRSFEQYFNVLDCDWKQPTDAIGKLVKRTAETILTLAEEIQSSTKQTAVETIARAIYAAVINDDAVEKYRKEIIERNRKLQADGIKAAKRRNVKFGRPVVPIPENFTEILEAVKNGEITVADAVKELKMGRSTFYRMRKMVQPDEPDFEVIPIPAEDAEETPGAENPVEIILPTPEQLDAVTEALEETAQQIDDFVQQELPTEPEKVVSADEEKAEETSEDLMEHPDYPGIKVTFAEYYLLEQFHGRTELFGHTLKEMNPDLFEKIEKFGETNQKVPEVEVTETIATPIEGKHAPIGSTRLEYPGVQSGRYVITKNNNIIDTQTGRRMTTMYKGGEQVVQLRTTEGQLILVKMIELLVNATTEKKEPAKYEVEEENLLEDFVWIDWMEDIPIRKYKVFKSGKIWDQLNGQWVPQKDRRVHISGGDSSSRTVGVVNRTTSIYASTIVWKAFHREDRDVKKLRLGFKDGDWNNCRLDNLIRKGGD